MLEPKPPFPSPNKIEMLLDPLFAVTKSSLPSLFTSPTAIELGAVPTLKLVAGAKLPLPSPKSTETLLEFLFTVAKSTFLSPLKSATTMSLGNLPTLKSVGFP